MCRCSRESLRNVEQKVRLDFKTGVWTPGFSKFSIFRTYANILRLLNSKGNLGSNLIVTELRPDNAVGVKFVDGSFSINGKMEQGATFPGSRFEHGGHVVEATHGVNDVNLGKVLTYEKLWLNE